MNELGYQRKIVKSVKKIGGYARKQSHSTAVGVPDLLLVVPGFVPVQAEVKLLRDCVSMFSRKLGVTERQRHDLREYARAVGERDSALILAVIEWRDSSRKVVLSALHHEETKIEKWSSMNHPANVLQGGNGFFDMKDLFHRFGVRRNR